jgi:hypothetical protein
MNCWKTGKMTRQLLGDAWLARHAIAAALQGPLGADGYQAPLPAAAMGTSYPIQGCSARRLLAAGSNTWSKCAMSAGMCPDAVAAPPPLEQRRRQGPCLAALLRCQDLPWVTGRPALRAEAPRQGWYLEAWPPALQAGKLALRQAAATRWRS